MTQDHNFLKMKLSVMPTLTFFFLYSGQVNNKLPFPLLFITSNASSFSRGGFAFCSPWLVKPELLGITVCGKLEWRRSRARASGSRGAAWVLSFSSAGHALPLSQHSWTGHAVLKSLSRVRLLVTPWTVAYQALSLSVSGLPFPSQGIFPTQGLNPGLPHCRQTVYRLSCQGSLAYTK